MDLYGQRNGFPLANQQIGGKMPPQPGFNIVPFSLPNCEPGEIRFEEPREITRVVVEFMGKAPARIGLSYLQKTWPQRSRPPDAA